MSPYSFHDPEKDGCENHECKDSESTGRACCQDTQELSPAASVPTPRDKEDAQECPAINGHEEECRTKSPNSNTLVECPAASPERGTCCGPALAQPRRGDRHTAKGLIAEQTSVPNSRGDAAPDREAALPQGRRPSPEDQRCEELAMEIAAKDSSLVDILVPHPLRKTALDLLDGLFPISVSMLDKSHRKKGDVQYAQECE